MARLNMDTKPELFDDAEDTGINFSQITVDLNQLVTALGTAVGYRFMSPEHATKIWRKWLAESGLDVQKQDKGGESRGTIEEN